MVQIPNSVNLYDLIGPSTSLKLGSRAKGGVYEGPCPWCGGVDRFHVWVNPPPPRQPGYWCRQCRRHGDAIDFLREYKGFSFVEACEELGVDLPLRSASMPASSVDGSPPLPGSEHVAYSFLPLAPTRFQRAEQQMLIQSFPRMRQALAQARKAEASHPLARVHCYLEQRGIPPALALASGMGYLLPDAFPPDTGFALWADRLVFLLGSPAGFGFIGRTLTGWLPGMTEVAHKEWLRAHNIDRWRKSYLHGWFGYQPKLMARSVVLVEGTFDRLALLAAGLRPGDVVALAGKEAQPDWLPARVSTVVLAFDADAGGHESRERLQTTFINAGKRIISCPPDVTSGRGKDWNERWQWDLQESKRLGVQIRTGVQSVIDAQSYGLTL